MQGNVLGSRVGRRVSALLAMALAAVTALVVFSAPAPALAVEQRATLDELPVTFEVKGTPKGDIEFSAKLEAVSEDAPMPEAGGEVATVTGAGTASFGQIVFTKPGVWDYKVTQTTQTDNTHWTLDETEYYLQIAATWKDDEHFVVEAFVFTTPDHTGTKIASVSFTNRYTADGKWEVDPGEKWYENGELKAGDFTFDIFRKNGDDWVWVAETTNAAGVTQTDEGHTYSVGSWAFEGIDLTEAGEYEYKVLERLPEGTTAENGFKLNGVTYDTTVYYYDVTVEAVDDEYKATNVELRDSDGTPVEKAVFTNVKDVEVPGEPVKPPSRNPNTGDATNYAVMAIVLGVGLVVVGCAVHVRRKARG